MKSTKILLVFMITCIFLNAQNVLTIGNEDISIDEFKNIFYKNNHEEEITKQYLDEYMNLFINFKLKVKAAESLGLDTLESFINELEGYRKQLAAPYLKNKEFDANMLEEAYNRLKKDINASHILFDIDKSDNNTYNKALKIRNDIISQKISFTDAAKKYSSDKSAMNNGGNLGYFTAFMMVYDFETAAYETDINNISLPIKTKYGYHLIKVNDKRDAVGEVKVAHIVFKTGQGAEEKQLKEAKRNIDRVMQLLNNGDDFADLAERFSQDRSTAVKGGALPAFGVGKMVPEFEKEAFSLENIGDYSQPFQTSYGWHIITILEKKLIGEFDEIKEELKRKIKRDSRGELSQKALLKKLRKEYNIKNYPSVYSNFRKTNVANVSNGLFISSKSDKTILFSIDNKKFSVSDFENYILLNQSKGSDIDKMYMDYVDLELIAFEEGQLNKKYPEYKALLKEYREGILLFDLTNKKVWRKAVEDSLGLSSFFKNNISNYQWQDRVDATIYKCIDFKTSRLVRLELLKKRFIKTIDKEEILSKINDNIPLSLQIDEGEFSIGDNKYIDLIDWKKGTSKDIKLDDGSYIVIEVNSVLSARSKILDEIRGKVISDYQSFLEKEWLNTLKKEYSVLINKDVLYSLVK